ncbi:MAG: helix-turn-helix domain-containing protein [Ignavibacteria bacterium]|nr:helix-turn-helix domain-containing protein [Ignavibacteria bacterium]
MKNITILIPEGAVLASIADPRYMFTAANEFLRNLGKKELFEVKLAAEKEIINLNDGMVSIHPDLLISEIEKTDLVIIPAISRDVVNAIELNKGLIPWVISQYKNGAEIASLCIGAFLFASTGLLNGKQCSTHWLYANQFRQMFPEVKLADDKVVTDQNGLYSSGGATSYWNLLLYLVEKYTDRETAIMASKFFLLDIGRENQSSFIIFRGQKDHGDDAVKKAQEYIELNFKEKITVDELCNLFGIGRRTFERRFKKATSNTIVEYIQRVKIEAAKKELESGRKTISEIMYEVGYIDSKAFREVFKKVAGLSPIDYRNKYNKAI